MYQTHKYLLNTVKKMRWEGVVIKFVWVRDSVIRIRESEDSQAAII